MEVVYTNHCCLTQTKKQEAFVIFLEMKIINHGEKNPTVVINHVFNMDFLGLENTIYE